MEIIRFESGDVIATSGNDPVYAILSGIGNGDALDNTLSVKNGSNGIQSVQNSKSPRNSKAEAVELLQNVFGSDITNRTAFWRDDRTYYMTIEEIFTSYRVDRDNMYSYMNGSYYYDATINEFQQFNSTN